MKEYTSRTGKVAVAGVLATALLTGPAFAHTGAGYGFSPLAGVVHPLLGVDHLAAMLAVGLWSAQAGGLSRWFWPVAFVAAMVVGAVIGHDGLALPAVQGGVAASVLVLGLLIAAAWRPALPVGAALVAAFALWHGCAHGAEAPSSGFAGYVAGFAYATAAIHVVGLMLGERMQAHFGLRAVRLAGAGIATTGAALIAMSALG